MTSPRIPTPPFTLRPVRPCISRMRERSPHTYADDNSSPTARSVTPAYQSAPTIRSGRASSSVRYQPYLLHRGNAKRWSPAVPSNGSDSAAGRSSGSLSGAESNEDELHSEHGGTEASRQSPASVEAAAASEHPPDRPAASPARARRSSPSKKDRKPTPEEIRKSKADAARIHRSRLNGAVDSIRAVMPPKHLNVAKGRMIPTLEQARVYIVELQQENRKLKASRVGPS
ncbi:hypothetical protein DENSPDRAFT_796768 [Dentipellis sp. KUC8613]|nr:hypothetical protein DENSPDRAFT_796768 [Dentipellis sp. KUC8613]